ncbi:MAG: RelA/SpoT family protein [Christensenellales bacterium]
MDKALTEQLNSFLAKAKDSFNEEDFLAVKYACEFGVNAHNGQKRASGEDYFTHPVAVADILLDMGLDSDTVIAGLLHDVIEDTAVTEEQFKAKIGNAIFDIVYAVTKLTRVNFDSTEVEQAENIRKLFFAMAKDIRVLLVKLADRLHNMRTLDPLPPEKRIKKSKETLDIYAPLAGRLGISWIKCEMEDLSMKYLYPEDYAYLDEKLADQRDARMVLINKVADELSAQLKDLNMQYEIKGRPKHYYSIFKKMKNQNKTFEQIYDLVAVRVIVESIGDCYTVLGIIHSMWKPIPGRFKDYIASPKPNMYQSLHTTIVTNFGQIFEIQIRTVEMNRIAEYGIAAHWRYKEGTTAPVSDFDRKLGFIKEIMDVQGDLKDSLEFIDTLKDSVSSNEIYVFTPKGTVFDLPVGSTCIDFAYRVHSEVGNKCVGVKVNNKITPVSTVLQNGDVVEVLTSNSAKGPNLRWLNYAKTPAAKAKIRSFFKKQMKEENIVKGKEALEKEAKKKGYNIADLMNPAYVKLILERYKFSNTDDMYASIGYGAIKTNQILFKLIDFYNKSHESVAPTAGLPEQNENVKKRRAHSGITIDGYDDFLIRLARCCNPVPGDKIIGYISRGCGVTVHRADCPNITNMEKERLMNAKWANHDDSLYNAPVYIECENKSSMIPSITGAMVTIGLQISSFIANQSKAKDKLQIQMGLEIKTAIDLDRAIKKLTSIKGIIKVERGLHK